MNTEKERKTDRRTLYTQMVIKEAMLSLLAKKEYGHITITDLCREAEISRGTFYLHYDNTAQVVDALFDDVLGNTHSVFKQIGCETAKDEACGYPLCRFLRENKKYQPLFFADSLFSLAVDRIVEHGFDHFSQTLENACSIEPETLRELSYFQLSGCLSVCRHNRNLSDDEWVQVQCSIDHLLKNGFQGL